MVGTVTISVEVELGWGYHDLECPGKYAPLSEDGRRERAAMERLLERLDASNVPVSFDVVGHLLLEGCDGGHDGPYPEGWFDADPGTDAESDPLFYAPDLVDAIDTAAVDHEICTHTFSHVLCDEVPPATVRADLEAVSDLHCERLGQPPVSLVTPRQREPPRDVLRECGIEVLRCRADDPPEGRLARLVWYLMGTQPVRSPGDSAGITETYASPAMSLTAYHLPTGGRDPHRAFRAIPIGIRQRLHERSLRRALTRVREQDSHLHLWTHLHDLANDAQWPQVEEFLATLGATAGRGNVRIATMADLRNGENGS